MSENKNYKITPFTTKDTGKPTINVNQTNTNNNTSNNRDPAQDEANKLTMDTPIACQLTFDKITLIIEGLRLLPKVYADNLANTMLKNDVEHQVKDEMLMVALHTMRCADEAIKYLVQVSEPIKNQLTALHLNDTNAAVSNEVARRISGRQK